jgi:hypothetical protein
MRCSSLLLMVLTFGAHIPRAFAAGTEAECPVTQAPAQPFVPPKGYHVDPGADFALGTLGLWANVDTHWKLNFNQNKIPFFSEDYIFGKSDFNPRLAVVARRLDSPAPLVWSDWVNGGGPPYSPPGDPNDHGFMVTGLPIPTVGCWEITAHYTPACDKRYTLTYAVWVGP